MKVNETHRKQGQIDGIPSYRVNSTDAERAALSDLPTHSVLDGVHPEGYLYYYYGHDFDSHNNGTWTMVSDHTGQKACSNESVWSFPPAPAGKTRSWKADPNHTCPGTGKWIVTVTWGG